MKCINTHFYIVILKVLTLSMKNDFNYNRYKDVTASETIDKAYNIFDSLGLKYTVRLNKNLVYGVYSSDIFFNDINYVSHGKGTTEEYSLASACGEALDRLLNYFNSWNYNPHINRNEESKKDFSYFYDESDFSFDDLETLPTCFIDDLKNYCKNFDDKELSNEDIINLYKMKFDVAELKQIPFYSVKTNNCVNLPLNVVDFLATSNGLSYGNTMEEAIVQGMSEIFERHASRSIYLKNLTPPEIPFSYIKEHAPMMLPIINDIIDNTRYKLHIFDASLGEGFPVVGTCFIDKDTKSYRFLYGCHPVFHIALERSITEILQKQFDIDNITTMINFNDALNRKIHRKKNRGDMCIFDVNSKFFDNTPSWEFIDWDVENVSKFTNKIGAKMLLKKALDMCPDVYIRNNGLFGTPSIRIYVPNLSYCDCEPLSNKLVISDSVHKIMQQIHLCDINSLSDEIKQKIINVLSGNTINYYDRRNIDICTVPVKNEVILALLYFNTKQYNVLIDNFIDYKDNDLIQFLVLYSKLILENKSIDDITKYMNMFYPEYVEFIGDINFNILQPDNDETFTDSISNFINRYKELQLEYKDFDRGYDLIKSILNE